MVRTFLAGVACRITTKIRCVNPGAKHMKSAVSDNRRHQKLIGSSGRKTEPGDCDTLRRDCLRTENRRCIGGSALPADAIGGFLKKTGRHASCMSAD
jgi:hypothetical protein